MSFPLRTRLAGAGLLLAFLGTLRLAGATVDLGVLINGEQISSPNGRVALASNVVLAITVTNASTRSASGVRLTNTLDPTLVFVSAAPSQGSCTHSDGVVLCSLGNVDSGATATVTVQARATVPGQTLTYAGVGANQTDEYADNDVGSATIAVGLSDVRLAANNPPPTFGGEIVTYSLTATNLGPDPTEMSLWAILPSVWAGRDELVSVEIDPGNDLGLDSPGFINRVTPLMPPGSFATLTVRIRAVWVGTVGIEASAFPPIADVDPDWSNNRAYEYTPVESGPGVIQFPKRTEFAWESRGSVSLEVERVGGSSGTVAVEFRTFADTARPGLDYVDAAGQLTFTNGQTRQTVAVNLVTNPALECARTLAVQLFHPQGAFLQTRTNLQVTIFDEDVVPRGVTQCATVAHDDPLAITPGEHYWPGLSADGRIALFGGYGVGVVTNEAPGFIGLFVRDLDAGATRLVSVNAAGTGWANNHVENAALSDGGRHVAFQSLATDLVTNSVGDWAQIYARDLDAGRTVLVSLSSANGQAGANNRSYEPLISSNGQVVVFTSDATDLVPDCHCDGSIPQLYARDLVAGVTRLITRGHSGTDAADGQGYARAVSPTGRLVLFASAAGNLVPGDTNFVDDLFVHDIVTGQTILVTANAAGTGPGNGMYMDSPPQLSADGRFVLFVSLASDLVPGDDNGQADVFLRDLTNRTTRLISVNAAGTGSAAGWSGEAAMTPDARFVAFSSEATNTVSPPAHTPWILYLRDLTANTTSIASVNCDGRAVSAGLPQFSGNGRFLAFSSYAPDVVPGSFDYPEWATPPGNIYRRDLQSGGTTLVSARYDLTGGSRAPCAFHQMSRDGRTILFSSSGTDLSAAQPVAFLGGGAVVYAWREHPQGPNADVRLTRHLQAAPTVMVLTLAVTNFGPETASDVVVRNQLPLGAQFLTAETTSGNLTVAGQEVTCSLGTLARRGGALVTVVAAPTADGTVPHQTSVTSAQPDPDTLNNAVTDAVEFGLPPPGTLALFHLEPRIFVSWEPGPAGRTLDYRAALSPATPWAPAPAIYESGGLKTHIATNAPLAPGFYRLHDP